jgi:hypothetical protein
MDPEHPFAHARRIGGPLPVEYLELVAWHYPSAGDGSIHLRRWTETGKSDPTYSHELGRELGPFTIDLVLPEMLDAYRVALRRMTGWKDLGPVSDAGC